MALPEVVSREQWLAARRTLLDREKEMTRAHDALNADRRRLPMVRIEKDYTFEGPDGPVTLPDLFAGRPQLIVQHVMFGPDWDEVCSGCTGSIEEQSEGLLAHLGQRNTNFVLVSRAPYPKIAAKKAERGWGTPWYSSFGSDFNYDFHVSLDQDVAPIQFNYRDEDELRRTGAEWILEKPSEQPGVSCFLRDGEAVYHTYSTFGRGSEYLGGAYTMLDLTALGRQEEWEEPKGRVEKPGPSAPFFT